MIDNVMVNIGAAFMIVGGAVLVSVVLGVAIYAAALILVSAINKLRRRAKRITRCKDCKYRGVVEVPCNVGEVLIIAKSGIALCGIWKLHFAATARERTAGLTMNNLDVAGILMTYSLKASGTKNTEDLRDLIRDLKQELDLRKVRVEDG